MSNEDSNGLEYFQYVRRMKLLISLSPVPVRVRVRKTSLKNEKVVEVKNKRSALIEGG